MRMSAALVSSLVLQCIPPRGWLSPRAAMLTNGWIRSSRPPHAVGLIQLQRFRSMSYCCDLLTNHLWLVMLMIHPIQGPYFSMMMLLKMTKKLLDFLSSSESIGLFNKGFRVAFYSFDLTVFIINGPTAPQRRENESRSSRSSRCPPAIRESK